MAWLINSTADLAPNNNNTDDIGTSAKRARSIYVGTSIVNDGDFTVNTAGGGHLVKRGTNATFGVVTLSGSGTAIIYSTKINTDGAIFLAPMNASGTAGSVSITTSVNAVSATAGSTNASDTRDVHWWIVNAA